MFVPSPYFKCGVLVFKLTLTISPISFLAWMFGNVTFCKWHHSQKIPHAQEITCERYYMRKILHAKDLICKRYYMQKILHAEDSTCKNITCERYYMQKMLHAKNITCKIYYRQKILQDTHGITYQWNKIPMK